MFVIEHPEQAMQQILKDCPGPCQCTGNEMQEAIQQDPTSEMIVHLDNGVKIIPPALAFARIVNGFERCTWCGHFLNNPQLFKKRKRSKRMNFVQICEIRNHLYTLGDDGNIYWLEDDGQWHIIKPPDLEDKHGTYSEDDLNKSDASIDGN